MADSNARTALKNNLQSAINDEETARIADIAKLTSSLTTEISNRENDVLNETNARINADTALKDAIAVERSRIDAILNGSSIDVNSFAEVVSQYSSLNTDALTQIANLNASVVAIQAKLAELTS